MKHLYYNFRCSPQRGSVTPKQEPLVFAGGDVSGSVNIVQAVNDGKTAAWFMHARIQEAHKRTTHNVSSFDLHKKLWEYPDFQ